MTFAESTRVWRCMRCLADVTGDENVPTDFLCIAKVGDARLSRGTHVCGGILLPFRYDGLKSGTLHIRQYIEELKAAHSKLKSALATQNRWGVDNGALFRGLEAAIDAAQKEILSRLHAAYSHIQRNGRS